MTEYIKREDVYLALNSHYFTGELSLRETIDSVPFADVVERTAPSVTTAWADREPSTYVLRKKGKWELVSTTKLYESGLYVDDEIEEKCSLCGCHTLRYETQKENNFCPNCGAKMEED